jgi:hypothetical protein
MASSSPYETLGLAALSTNTFVSNTLTSTSVIKMQGEDSLFIHASMVADESSDILTHIYVSGNSDYSNVQYQNPAPLELSKPFLKLSTPVWTFSLTDENGMLMNLNNLNWLLTITVYKTLAPLVASTLRMLAPKAPETEYKGSVTLSSGATVQPSLIPRDPWIKVDQPQMEEVDPHVVELQELEDQPYKRDLILPRAEGPVYEDENSEDIPQAIPQLGTEAHP